MHATQLSPADFSQLARFSRVLVSGPQRSGTNLISHAVSDATGHQYVPETEFASTWAQRWWEIILMKEDIVIHCPGMCRWLHIVGRVPELAVVVVIRDVNDIIASQERIGWVWEPYELMMYDRLPDAGPIAAVKYAAWESQKKNVINAFEVRYEDMREHPMWVEPELRQDFESRQVELGDA